MARACGTELNAVSIPGDACDSLSGLPWDDWAYDPFYIPTPYVMSIAKARRDFDLHVTPLADWVAETVEWYRANPADDSAHYGDRDREVSFAERWRRDYGKLIGA